MEYNSITLLNLWKFNFSIY